jgi:hypothetical protein
MLISFLLKKLEKTPCRKSGKTGGMSR